MKRIFLAALLLLGMVVGASAQPSVGVASRVSFDIAAPSLATAQGYTYRTWLDDATTGTVITVACTNLPQTGVFNCTSTTPVPALTLGSHTIRVNAADAVGDGPLSTPFSFTVVAVPNAPTNVRLVR